MQSILNYFTQRSNSKFLVSFIAFFVIIHWKAISVALFVDQDLIYNKYGILKDEYMQQFLFRGNLWLDIGYGFLLPTVLAFIYVRVVPIFYNWLYKYEADFDAARKLTKKRADQRILDADAKAAKTKVATSKSEVEVAENLSRIRETNPEAGWMNEFEEFINIPDGKQALRELSKTIYQYRGADTHISPISLELCDLYELYNRGDGLISDDISPTDKGRYFLKLAKVHAI